MNFVTSAECSFRGASSKGWRGLCPCRFARAPPPPLSPSKLWGSFLVLPCHIYPDCARPFIRPRVLPVLQPSPHSPSYSHHYEKLSSLPDQKSQASQLIENSPRGRSRKKGNPWETRSAAQLRSCCRRSIVNGPSPRLGPFGRSIDRSSRTHRRALIPRPKNIP